MKMKPKYRKGGYSNQTAEQYVSLQAPIYLLSEEIEPQQKFEDGKPTGEIIAYKTWFGQKGLPPFQVKFLDDLKPEDKLIMIGKLTDKPMPSTKLANLLGMSDKTVTTHFKKYQKMLQQQLKNYI